MKRLQISSGHSHYRFINVPDSWEEADAMLKDAMRSALDVSGGNMTRNSISGRVVLGMFGECLSAPDPTTALNFLLQRICERKGAGLDR